MSQSSTHFDGSTVASSIIGACVGFVLVMVGFAAAIAISGLGFELMGVALLAALFGGTGFGAMLGAVLGSLNAQAVPVVPSREHLDEPA